MSEQMVSVQLSEHELVLLANALNEAREAVDDWEFHTRLGANAKEADDLRLKLENILAALNRSK